MLLISKIAKQKVLLISKVAKQRVLLISKIARKSELLDKLCRYLFSTLLYIALLAE
jgi:hypothetical protein